MKMSFVLRFFAFTLLSLLLAGCGSVAKKGKQSQVKAAPQDGLISLYQVPRPASRFTFLPKVTNGKHNFPKMIPLVATTKSIGDYNTIGYYILCDDPEQQSRILEALGFSAEDFEKLTPLLSEDIYNDKDPKDHCESFEGDDPGLCLIKSLAPEKQLPVICPASLGRVGKGNFTYNLVMNSTGDKFYADYQLNRIPSQKYIELGCLELKDALFGPGKGLVTERIIVPTQVIPTKTDLNCLNGSSTKPVVESFEALCQAARSDDSPPNFATLNAIINHLNLSASSSCSSLRQDIETSLSKTKSWDLSSTNISNLTLLKFFPALESLVLKSNKITDLTPITKLVNLKNLDLSNNPNLGAGDTESSSSLRGLASLPFLNKLSIVGTRVANVVPLSQLVYLNEMQVAWSHILPQTCSTESVAPALQTACSQLQKPIEFSLDGQTKPATRYVSRVEELDLVLSAAHHFAPENVDSFFRLTPVDGHNCPVNFNGLQLKATTLPTSDCVIAVAVSGDNLPGATLKIPVSRLGSCEGGHEAGSTWTVAYDDKDVTYKCVRQGNQVASQIDSGVCKSKQYSFDKTRGECVATRCTNGKAIGEDERVKTSDRLGHYEQTCILLNDRPELAFKAGSGSCDDTRYDFSNGIKNCVLVRCSNGRNLNATWFDASPGLEHGQLEYRCMEGEIRPQTTIRCDNNFLLRERQCLQSCGSNHAIGDAAWFEGHGSYVCFGSTPALQSCDTGYLGRGNICRKTCDKNHAEGDDAWVENNGTYTCQEDSKKLVSCSDGYLARGESCKIKCDAIHAEGDDPWSTGNGRFVCSGASTKVSSCNAGYGIRGNSCKKLCDSTHAVDDPAWSEANGIYSCGESGSVLQSCSSGYLGRGNACEVSCDGTHAVGDGPWTGVNGRFQCLGSSVVPVSCNEGFKVQDKQCVPFLPSSNLSPSSHSFYSVDEGEVKIVTITVSNSGGPAALDISIKKGHEFRLGRGTCPAQGAIMAASASCTVTVSFTGGGQCGGDFLMQSAILTVALTSPSGSSSASTVVSGGSRVYKFPDPPCL